MSSRYLNSMCLVALVVCALPTHSAEDWNQDLAHTPRTPKAGRTLVYTTGQLKYGLGNANGPTYIGRWVDRPLFVDPELATERPSEGPLADAEYFRIQETLQRYDLDGFAFYPQNGSCAAFYATTARSPVQPFSLLTQLSAFGDSGATVPAIIAKALACKNSLFIDGKLMITSYVSDSQSPEYWKTLLDDLRGEFGDRFCFIPEVTSPGGVSVSEWLQRYRAGTITREATAAIKEHLRAWLRATDGISISGSIPVKGRGRVFDADHYREFVIPVLKSVLSEPEFQSKFLSIQAFIGHENSTSLGRTISHDGTKTLRHSFEAAVEAAPDLIVIPEWDEENENTCLRPTVYNGLSSMRIMRYYMARLKGQDPTPMPSDDRSIPDLTISYRKLLTLGEELDIELLNVPDSTERTDYTVELSLEDLAGNVVRAFPPQTLNTGDLKDATLVVASEDFAEQQVLIPHLSISYKGRQFEYEDGLHYIELRPTWNWDYKWVKQPLRDLLAPAKSSFTQLPNADRLLRTFAVEFEAPEDLAYLEVLDNDDVVYVAEAEGEPPARETADMKVLQFITQSIETQRVSGRIAVEGASSSWKGNELVFNDAQAFVWSGTSVVGIPTAEADQAVLDIAIPGVFTGKVPVKQILEDQAFAVSGERGLCISVNRFIRQHTHPKHLKRKGASFRMDLVPDLKTSVIHMQAIAKSGRTYRSKPIPMHQRDADAATKEIVVFSEAQDKPVRVALDADRVPFLDYEFTSAHGSALLCDEGRAMFGVLGGFCPQVTMRGAGESAYGNPFYFQAYPQGATKTYPDWVPEGAGHALRFSGPANHAVLPQGAIPRRAGFELTMEIMPDDVSGTQFLLGNREYYPGSMYELYIRDGVLKAAYLNEDLSPAQFSDYRMDSGLRVEPGQWSTVRVLYDLETLRFEVNGVVSEPLRCPGPGLYDTLTVIGGFGDAWFRGKLRRLTISHAAPRGS